jgi:hypothetical protein
MPTFATPAAISAVLDLPAGRVRFIAADRSDTVVEVLPADASKPRDVKAAEQTTVDYSGGVLRVETPVKNQLLGASGAVEVTVQLPTGSRVEAKAASAEIRAVGRLADFSYEGSEGTLKLDEAATAHVKTDAGNVEIGRLTGPATITTRKGGIRVNEATRGELTLKTDLGNITVKAAPGVSATLNAGATQGRIVNTLKNAEGPAAQLSIHATTTLGDIEATSL